MSDREAADNVTCRHCRDPKSEHRILFDEAGDDYLVCPGSLEDNTFDEDGDEELIRQHSAKKHPAGASQT